MMGSPAQTSPFKVSDAPKGHRKESRTAAGPILDEFLREIADPKRRGLMLQPAA
jgi:hypothetical protein